MRVLLVDNYDSFTFNLAQLVASITGELPRVVRNDDLTVDEILAWCPERVILSPGPGRPEVPSDIGVCGELIARLGDIPIFGVCLGHQAIATAFGARIVHAPEPMHGRLSTIEHDGSGIFAKLPKRFRAVRYHSLVVDRASLPSSLRVTAWSDDGLVMALAHSSRPIVAVQFHPESVLSECGRALMANFLAAPSVAVVDKAQNYESVTQRDTRKISLRELKWVDPERVFAALFSESKLAFWLDSPGGGGRFSYLGEGAGEVRCDEGRTRIDGVTVDGDPFAIIDGLLGEHRDAPLPFELSSGLVGYLGYGMKRFCGGEVGPHRDGSPPDAWLMRASRVIAFDHVAHSITLVAPDGDARWLDDTARRVAAAPEISQHTPLSSEPIEFRLARNEQRYREDIAEIQRLLREGETYEICLTTQVRSSAEVDPFSLYRVLRVRNPAPYAALLRFGDLTLLSSSPERFVHVDRHGAVESRPIKGTRPRGFDIADDLRLVDELRTSEKDRAENLMIVDLVRNDLGRVCRVASVHVPSLMQVETHPTVLQLVSTVRGQLADGVSPLDALRALFPGGSMTGAPKIRSMRIIDALEGEPRGVYAGGIGFLSHSGAIDLAMAIRTIVARPGELSFGVGGAIVAQSDPDAEIEELRVKGRALMESIAAAAGAPSYRLS